MRQMMQGRRGRVATGVLALTFATTACGGDEEVAAADDAEAAADTAEADATDEGDDEAETEATDEADTDAAAEGEFDPKQLPDFFPEAIPLPDDYLVVGDSSGEYDEVGRTVSLNIAIGGTIEEAREHYPQVLQSEFEDVAPPDDPTDENLPWTFSGQGFETGALYISANTGLMDRGRVDSTHLDVQLTINMDERAYEGD